MKAEKADNLVQVLKSLKENAALPTITIVPDSFGDSNSQLAQLGEVVTDHGQDALDERPEDYVGTTIHLTPVDFVQYKRTKEAAAGTLEQAEKFPIKGLIQEKRGQITNFAKWKKGRAKNSQSKKEVIVVGRTPLMSFETEHFVVFAERVDTVESADENQDNQEVTQLEEPKKNSLAKLSQTLARKIVQPNTPLSANPRFQSKIRVYAVGDQELELAEGVEPIILPEPTSLDEYRAAKQLHGQVSDDSNEQNLNENEEPLQIEDLRLRKQLSRVLALVTLLLLTHTIWK